MATGSKDGQDRWIANLRVELSQLPAGWLAQRFMVSPPSRARPRAGLFFARAKKSAHDAGVHFFGCSAASFTTSESRDIFISMSRSS